MAKEFSLEEALGRGTKTPTEFSLEEALGTPAPAPQERTIGESIKDVGAGLVSGLGSIVQVPGQLYGLATGDFSDRGLLGVGQDISEYGEEMKSAGLKAREAERARAVEAASQEGQFAAFKTALGQTITDPALLTTFLAEQAPQVIPMILAGGGAGYIASRKVMSEAAAKGAAMEAAKKLASQRAVQAGTTAAIQTGAVMQGSDVGAGAYDDIVAGLIDRGATPEEAAEEAINKARAAGLTGYALSVLANRYLPGGKALEEILAGKRLTGSVLGSAAVTGLKEIPSENIEEVGGRIAQNIAVRSAGLDRDIMSGTGEAAAMATIGAAGIGGAAGALSRKQEAGAEPETPEAVAAFERDREQFVNEFGEAEAVQPGATELDVETLEPAAVAPVEPPVELPGGFTVARREVARQEVPEAFGIFQEGSDRPLVTVGTPQEAEMKLESLTQIRQEEQQRLRKESEKIDNALLAERRKIEVMEATGQTDTDQYVQAKAMYDQKQQEAAETLTNINNQIESYFTPLTFAPIGRRTEVQNEFVVNRGEEPVGVFPSFEAAQSTVEQLAPEAFKQAEQARVQARMQEIDSVLKPAFAKFNLGDVGLNIVEAIKTDDGQSADGSYARNLIQVAMDAEKPLQTMRHESMHALKELQFFTPQQWKALTERAEKEWINKYLQSQPAQVEIDGKMQQVTRLDAYKRMGLSQEAIVEEAIADAFGAYDRGATPPPGMIAALFKKLQNFFANFGQALRGAGFESADDIFQRIERGELKSRKPKAEKTSNVEKLSLAGAGVPMSTRNVMEQQTPIAQQDLGLNTEAGRSGTNNVRDIAKALNRQTLDQLGAMNRNKLTQDESTRISEAIADEVAYQLQTSSKTGTGLGWYSNNYPNAVKRLGKRFPELSTSKYARSVFSALVAVTSNGERVTKNIDNAIKLYADLRKGKSLVAMGNRRATALENNLQVIQDLMAEHGENFEKVLLKEITVAEMNARLRKMGKKSDGSYLANTVVPAAAVYFGPKLGAFYANLSGSEGYLTMDLWWARSINRMRGLLIPKATNASISKFRDMMGNPDATRDEVVAATIPLRNKYEEYGWNSELEHLTGAKEPSTKAAKPAWFEKAEKAAGDAYEQLLFEHNLEKMANTIYKNEFEMLEEAPFTATDRKFMYDAARKAQTLLRNDGIDLSLADIQAALWYYEKRLYAKLSGRKADDIGYEEAIIAQANQGSGRARPSVVFDKRTDRGDDSKGEVSGTEAVRGEPAKGAKLSLKKGVVAEVAPNPDHISAEKWREMTAAERLDATKSVANKVMSSVFSELGLRGYSYSFSTGKYEGEVNPNIIVEAPESATEQELEELGRVLGYVLDQKAMVVFDEDNKTSGSQAGFVKVRIPKEMTQEQLDEFRGHIAMVVPQADGDTLRDGELVYGNFSAYNDSVDTLSDDQYHGAIIKAIESFPYDGDIMVSDPETFHSSFIWPETRSDYLKETRYGDSGEIQREAGADVRGQGSRRLQAISEEGIALRDRWIDGRGAARLGGRERGNAVDFGQPTAEYGTPRQGSVSATGIHFSKQQRPEIRSNFYGTGLRGLEGERLAERANADIRDRIYFYVDNGKGVTPESGVGGIPHVIKLNNLYDTSADPLQIIKNVRGESAADRANKWERDVKRAGFDGYLVKDPVASQDYAVLIGKHAVKTGKYSLRAPTTPEFKRWFGDSKVVDADGNPLVVYRGEGEEVTEYKKSKLGKALSGSLRKAGFFFSPIEEEAGFYAQMRGSDIVNSVYLSIQNPFVVDSETWKDLADWGSLPKQKYKTLSAATKAANELVAQAKANGHDGLFLIGRRGAVAEYVAFEPNQIKSATGNIGTYDPKNPDIRYSLKNVRFPSVKAVKEAVKGVGVPNTPEFKRFIAGNQWNDADGKPTVFYHATAREFFEFVPAGQSQAIFLATTPEEAETFGSAAEDKLRREIYRAINKDEKLDFFQGVVNAQVEKGTITKKQGEDFIRQAKRKIPEYGDFGDIEQEVYDALLDLSPTRMSIMPLWARAETPFDFENADHVEQVMQWVTNNTEYPQEFPEKWLNGLKGRIKQGLWQAIEDKRVQLALRTLGFDSFTVRENRNSPKNYAVYKPEQVKSVTGNLGEYGREEKNIRYSLQPVPQGVDDRINETTTVREKKGFAKRIVEAIAPETRAKFRALALNRYNQLSVYDKKLAEQMGGSVLLADQSAESAALMSDVAAGVAASAMGFGNRTGGIPVLRNGITTIDSSVKGLIASLEPLAAYGDAKIYQRYQYWAMVKRGVRLNAQGKQVGITTADVAYAKMLQDMHPEFVGVQKDLIAFNNGLVKYMVDTGVLSKGRAAEYVKYADYVPFYRQMDGEKTLGPNIFSSISGVRPPKQLKGGDAPLADFLETMVRNTTAAIQAGAKNYAGKRAMNVVEKVKAPGMGATRLAQVSNAPNVINILENGELVSYETADDLLLYAVKSLNLSELPFMSIVSAPADLLRNLVTRDPGFMMANLLRDSLSAYVTSGKDMTPVVDTVINFGKALGNMSPTTRALLDAGVISGYDTGNIEESGQNLEEDLARKAGKRKDSILLRPFKSVWEGLEAGTTASDAATRAVIYERVLAETGNEAEALYRALEVMNFHRKGGSALVRVLTAAVPFFNARLQGLDLFYRASTGNMNTQDAAAVRGKFWARGMTMMALSGLYWFLVSDDEEYKKQEQETKDNNWIFPGLGFRMPIPFEVGLLFKTLPERVAAYAFGDDTGEDLKGALGRGLVSTFAFNPIPQTVKPLVEAAFDFNTFTWRPILSEGMKDVATEYQVGPSTSITAVGFARSLGLSPIKVDHVIKGYTGTMGMYAIDAIDAVIGQFSDTPKATKRFEQMPVIKRFSVDAEARGNVTQYYQLKDSVDTVVRTMNLLEKTGESEAYVDYVTKNRGTLAFKDYIRDTEKTMTELRSARRAIRASAMSGDEKRDALLEISRAESQITSQIQRIKQAIASIQ